MRPPWICASTLSGLTTVPQSTARRHAADRDLAIGVDLRLDDRRDIGAEHALAGDAASGPRRKRASPARLLRGEIEAGEQPRLLRKMRAPEGDRILPRACASSSTKLSTTKMLWPGPTLRQKQVGTPGGSACTYST